jgi:hypothetical protein
VDEDQALPALAGVVPEDAARRLVGPRADYYLVRWAWIERSGRAVGFNWPAFWLGPFWMLYRRMYRTFAIAIGAITLVVALESLAAYLLHIQSLPQFIERGITIAQGVVIGSYGSYWYFVEVRRRYERIRSVDGFTDSDFDRAGGVSWGAPALGVAVLVGLIFVGVTLAASAR